VHELLQRSPGRTERPSPPPRSSKYHPLYLYLKRQAAPEVVLTTRSIEALIKRLLPGAASKPGWWLSAEANKGEPARSWQAAGYMAELEHGGQAVRFRRVERAQFL